MSDKTFKQLCIAILVAICSAVVAFFSSCASARYDRSSVGKTSIYVHDTTIVDHSGNISIKIK